MRHEQAAFEDARAAPAPAATGLRPAGDLVLRRARPGDAAALAELEQAVFPTLWPRSNFERETRRPGHIVLLAAGEEDGEATAAPEGDNEEPVRSRPPDPEPSAGPFTRVLETLRSLVIPAPGGAADGPSAGTLAGYVTVWVVAGEAHVAAIGVRPKARGRGVGELLLLGAIEAAAEHSCATVTLEVRSSNEAAQALYRKYGFRDVGLRKRYYVDNGEDAVIMTTPRISDPEYAEKLAALSDEHAVRAPVRSAGSAGAGDGKATGGYPSAEPG